MKEIKPNYIIIPGITLFIAGIGRYFSDAGMAWYYTLARPDSMPPGWVFGVVWNTLYVCMTLVALWLYNRAPQDRNRLIALSILSANAVANGLWSYLFFYKRMIFAGLIDCMIVLITAIALAFLVAKQSRFMAAFVWVYVAWMLFATYTNFLVWQMN